MKGIIRLTIIVAILVVLALYIRYYTKTNDEEMAIYDSLYNITDEQLDSKTPIIIDEGLESREVIKQGLLEGRFSKSFVGQMKAGMFYKGLAKYNVILNENSENLSVKLISPKYTEYEYSSSTEGDNAYLEASEETNRERIENEEYVEVILAPQQGLVIPTYWGFQTDADINAEFLFDSFNYIVSKISLLRAHLLSLHTS